MKKLFAFLLSVAMLCAFTVMPSKHSDAQIVKTYSVVGKVKTDTLGSSADTAFVSLAFDGSFKSVELYAKKISGTVSAKHYFEGKTLDGGSWVKLDSLTVADVATDQFKIISVPNPRTYQAYRVSLYSATGTTRVKVYACRYTGG
jgi:allantoicase